VAQLHEQGVYAIVAMVHEGGNVDPRTQRLTGPIANIVPQLDPDVDVVLSAHPVVTRRSGAWLPTPGARRRTRTWRS
jgi:hypothetical protein